MRNAALSLFALLLSASVFGAGRNVTAPVLGPSPLGASFPTVATNGQTFVSLWYRNGELYGAIADATGHRQTSADIAVMPVPYVNGVTAALTNVGPDYFLFWSDQTSSYLTELGSDLKPQKTSLLSGVPNLVDVSIASNGSQILVTGYIWSPYSPSRSVAYLLNATGSVTASPIEVGAFPDVHVSWSGRDFLLADANATGVFLDRVNTAGQVQKLQVIPATAVFTDPLPARGAAASSGDEVVLTWAEQADAPNPTQTFWTATITTAGVVSTQQVFSRPAASVGKTNIFWNGQDYLATYGNLVLRLDRGGRLAGDPINIDIAIDDVVALGNLLYGVAAFDPNPRATILDVSAASFNARSEFLSITPAAQYDPAIASDGIDFMTAFREETATTKIVSATTTGPSQTQPGTGIAIADTTGYAQQAIAYGNSMYLTTWADAHGVFARRIAPQGVILDAQPIKISANNYPQRPDVVWNGNAFLVVWVGDGGVVDASVAADGTVSATHLIAAGGSMEPRIAWNGKVSLVVYGTELGCPFDPCPLQRAGTYAVRVAPDGTAIDATSVRIDPAPMNALAAFRATVASDGSDFLVALDWTSGPMTVQVNGEGPTLVASQPNIVFPWFAPAANDIRWNGHEYVLASVYGSGAKTWLALTNLAPDGVPASRNVTEISPAESTAAVASNSLGDDAVVVVESIGEQAMERVQVYFNADFAAPPVPPAAPTNVAAIGTPANFTMTWNVGPDADGVLIETTFGPYTTLTVVPASEHSHTFNSPAITSVVLRTFNAGGVSNAVGAILQVPPRRRAAR